MVAINKDKEALITQELLKERLHYDKDTGVFTWTDSKLNSNKMRGKKAGTLSKVGYVSIGLTIETKTHLYSAHRLAWFYVYGEFPKLQLDHINHDRLDNRISNLREVTNKENQRNVSMRKDNTSGYSGVWFNKVRKKYQAGIRVNYRRIHLGCFEKIEDAAKAAKEGREHYGFHKNHGAAE